MMEEHDCKELLARVLSLSKADATGVSISGGDGSNVRFALNSVTTSGAGRNLSVSIGSSFGRRSGSASTDQIDPASLEKMVRKSEELARVAPEDPEYLPPVDPQKYVESPSFDQKTADAAAADYAALCLPGIRESEKSKVSSAGFIEGGSGFSAVANSKGLFGFQKSTSIDFSMTARAHPGISAGSGWAGTHGSRIANIDASSLAHEAVRKCVASHDPVALDPGKYTVILEASAVSDLLGELIWQFDARNADEGRSFLTKKGGGNLLGEKVFGEDVTFFSDPANDMVPGGVFAGDGQALKRRTWVEKGVVKELQYSRYWAEKKHQAPNPGPSNLILPGGDASIDDLIAQADRAVLVTRFWYIRMLDPQTVLLTGLTRDGTFLIEKGKITKPVNNFRFNESPVAVLNNVIAKGRTQPARGGEGAWSIAVPPLLVKDFTFSSVSKAV